MGKCYLAQVFFSKPFSLSLFQDLYSYLFFSRTVRWPWKRNLGRVTFRQVEGKWNCGKEMLIVSLNRRSNTLPRNARKLRAIAREEMQSASLSPAEFSEEEVSLTSNNRRFRRNALIIRGSETSVFLKKQDCLSAIICKITTIKLSVKQTNTIIPYLSKEYSDMCV